LKMFETRWIPRQRFRAILSGGLLALGGVSLVKLAQFLWALRNPEQLQMSVNELVITSNISSTSGVGWFYARLILEGIVGSMLLVASILLITGRERRGIQLGYLSLLLSLTTVNLLVFYFDQFSTIILAIIQFLLLIGVIHYRKRYLFYKVELIT
jgi:hypothetical protein